MSRENQLQNRNAKNENIEYKKQKLYQNTLLIAFYIHWLVVLYFQFFSKETMVYIGLIDKSITVFELLYTPMLISIIVYLFNRWIYFKNKWVLFLSIISSLALFLGMARILELWP